MINIFIDKSGSMAEMGKNRAAIYAAKSIEDYCEFYDIKSALYNVHGERITDISTIKFTGKFELKKLKNFIKKNNLKNNIIISDGLFNDLEKIENTIAIMIGIDADKDVLEKICDKVFESENILSAIEYLFFKSNIILYQENEDDEW